MQSGAFKKLVKSRVLDFWEGHLRLEALKLKYFKPEFMSLTRPHSLLSSCGSNPFEVHKAVVQAKMLSGTYITDKLASHWTPNFLGLCSIPGCTGQDVGGFSRTHPTVLSSSE